MTIKDYKQEDLTSNSDIASTVPGVNKNADDWVEQAASAANAVSGFTYVKLNRGLMTVSQLDSFLNSMPFELTYADANNQFVYYNAEIAKEKLLSPRSPEEVGNPLSEVHPPRAVDHVKKVINDLRTGKEQIVKLAVPGADQDHFCAAFYIATHDEKGDYAGVNEIVIDLMPTIKWYLQESGQKLVHDENAQVDNTTGASKGPTNEQSEEVTTNISASRDQLL